jgi:hypothetical protein
MSVRILEAEARFPYNSTLGIDHKAWAKRIIYRLEHGDTSLLSVQITFAKMALNIDQEQAA